MRTLIFILLLFSAFCATGQSISYQYDNAGNRIVREIVFGKKGSGDTAQPARQDTAAIEEELENEESIALYPNPTTRTVKLDFSNEEQEIQELRIIDQRGQLHFQKKNLLGDQELDFSPFSRGTYFISLKLQGQKVRRYTVVKQ